MTDMQHILVVDDEPEILSAVSHLLLRNGFEVKVAADGLQALGVVMASQIDLVLLDIAMPQLDGLDVLRVLRERHPELAIIMLTVRDDERTKLHGFELGADDYITKPFASEELLARMRSLLRRRSVKGPATVAYDDGVLSMDAAAGTITQDGTVHRISRAEFEFLRMLVAAPGTTISAQALTERAWNVQYDDHPAVLKSALFRLRRKMNWTTKGPVIASGNGYLFIPNWRSLPVSRAGRRRKRDAAREFVS